MEKLHGALLFGQSGGPTSVINASAAGVFLEALKHEEITEIYGAEHGIRGILEERFYDIRMEDREELLYLKNTPSSALGSVRYKLKSFVDDESDYKKILAVFKKYNIRYFLYNGGNDSMDTCFKIAQYLKAKNYSCNVMGVPKTIDNDLAITDHCPGFGSAARYVATTTMEIAKDMMVYDTGLICVVEVMGRNAGWLTAASALANVYGKGPDLVYLPELPFAVDKFLLDVKEVLKANKNHALIVVSEGIKDKDGRYITETFASSAKDSFGHVQLGGLANVLADYLKEQTGIKVRPIEFSLMQRCGAHLAAGRDINEAFNAGAKALQAAIKGVSGKMVAFERVGDYKIKYRLIDVRLVANAEKKVPLSWINDAGNGIKQEFIDYALPLIQGKNNMPLVDNLPRFARLKKILVCKKENQD